MSPGDWQVGKHS